MALDPSKIEIDTPVASIGDTMSKIRSWLDANKIEPVEFKTSTHANAVVSFMIRFNREADATAFERAFSTPQLSAR